MATLSLYGGTEFLSWTISGLSSTFSSSNYTEAGIAKKAATSGSTTAPSGIVDSISAPSSSTAKSCGGSLNYSAGTYTFYGWVTDTYGRYYPCGSATVTIDAEESGGNVTLTLGDGVSYAKIAYVNSSGTRYPSSGYNTTYSGGTYSSVDHLYVDTISLESGYTFPWYASFGGNYTSDTNYDRTKGTTSSVAINVYPSTGKTATLKLYASEATPPSFSVAGITDTQAVVSYWDTSGFPYIYIYVRTGTVSGSGSEVYSSGWISTGGSSGQRTITGLSPNTTYTVNVRYNTTNSATGASWVGGRQFTTLTAYSYTITYYKNDGTSTYKTSKTTSGTNTTQSFTVPSPDDYSWSRTGYYFQGWYNSSTLTGTQYLVGSTYTTTADKSIYAHWQPNSYTIYFNGNGSTSGSMSSMSCYYGSSYTLTSNAYKRSYTLTYDYNYTGGSSSSKTVSCTFSYWSCNGSTYKDGATVSNLMSTNGGSVTMYAQWEYGSITLPTPTRSGYSFDGWYNSSGTYIGSGGSSYTVKSDQTLYAHWTESVIQPTVAYSSHTDTTITVTLNRNGGITGTWTIQASTSSSFGSIAASTTISNTSTTSVTLSGLSENTTYYIRAINTVSSATATSSTLTASTRISQFQWTSDDSSNIVAGEAFADMITAKKWNDLIDRVDWCRSKSGLSASGQSDVTAGSEMTAAIFNAMRNAIANMESGVTGTKTTGEEIQATYFANVSSSLKTAINTVITRL